MALLVKRATSPFYYARFQVNGKDRWLSTKKTDRKEAQQVLKLLLAEARDELSIDEQVAVLERLLAALPKEVQAARRQEVVRKLLRAQEKKLALEDTCEDIPLTKDDVVLLELNWSRLGRPLASAFGFAAKEAVFWSAWGSADWVFWRGRPAGCAQHPA